MTTSGKNQYLSQRFLNGMNGATSTIATPLFIALFTTTPSISTFGTEVTAAGSYASVSITGNSTNWPTISGSTTTMTSGATFTYTTASADWSSAANIVAAALKDSGSNGAGNMYWWGALTGTPGPVLSGNTASFATGAVTIAETLYLADSFQDSTVTCPNGLQVDLHESGLVCDIRV